MQSWSQTHKQNNGRVCGVRGWIRFCFWRIYDGIAFGPVLLPNAQKSALIAVAMQRGKWLGRKDFSFCKLYIVYWRCGYFVLATLCDLSLRSRWQTVGLLWGYFALASLCDLATLNLKVSPSGRDELWGCFVVVLWLFSVSLVLVDWVVTFFIDYLNWSSSIY